MNDLITRLIEQAGGKEEIKLKFLNRLEEGRLTRDENPTSHLCSYFPAYDPKTQKVFIGLHKKSGLWLVNGGHMHNGELPVDAVVREAKEEWGLALSPQDIPNPQILTLTEIEQPKRQVCEWHYDFWHFLSFDENLFHPDPTLLTIEFSEYGWKSYDEATPLFSDPNSFEALAYLRNLT